MNTEAIQQQIGLARAALDALAVLATPTPEPPEPVACSNCGHAIRHCYVVEIGGGRRTVGSECVVSLLGIGATADVKRWQKRMRLAKRQWKERMPAPRDGEDETDYLNRRLAEMGNAAAAYAEYVKRRPKGERIPSAERRKR